MRAKWLLISVLAVAAGIGAGALSMRFRREPPPATRPDAAVVAVKDVTLSGSIRPKHVVGVGSQVQGNIEAFLADVGQEVFEGQVLARIGAANLEADRETAQHGVEAAQDLLSKAEASVNAARLEASRAAADAQRSRSAFERAEKTYNRQQTLNAAGATPRIVYEKARDDLEAAIEESKIMDKASAAADSRVQMALEGVAAARKLVAERTADLEDAQVALGAAEVRAPVDGLITGRSGEVGKPAAEAGENLFLIATDIYALDVVLEPTPPVLKQLQPGQEALVLILDLQASGIPGVISEIKNGRVTVDFNSTLPAIKPGMRADVRLKLE